VRFYDNGYVIFARGFFNFASYALQLQVSGPRNLNVIKHFEGSIEAKPTKSAETFPKVKF